MQSETGFPSSHQLKSYVAYKSRLKLAARAVLSADAGLLVTFMTGRHYLIYFWATVCKTVRPMLWDRCLSVCLSVTLVHCGQRVEWIKMPLCTEIGLGPRDIVLDKDPAPPTERGTAVPTFRPMSIVAKGSPISATAELLLFYEAGSTLFYTVSEMSLICYNFESAI